MGNTSATGSNIRSQHSSLNQEDPLVSQKIQLEASFKEYVKSQKENSPGLLKETFQKLFPVVLQNFVSALLDNASPGQQRAQVISCQQYINLGCSVMEVQQLHQEPQFFFRIFSDNKEALANDEFGRLLEVCFSTNLEYCCVEYNSEDFAGISSSLKKSLYGLEERVTSDDFCRWYQRHFPRGLDLLLESIISVLNRRNALLPKVPQACSETEILSRLKASRMLLNVPVLWALSSILPAQYFPSTSSNNRTFMGSVLNEDAWHILYDSNEHGFSANRFQSHLLNYNGPTVILLAFQDNVYCIACDEEWKEHWKRQGGHFSALVQIRPQFKLIQNGPEMLYFNIHGRWAPRGLQVGKDIRNLFLDIDEGLTQVKQYGQETPLSRIEVWGCGGKEALQKQLGLQQWEKQEAEKLKNRKIKISRDEWQDNPDKAILDLAGVETEHAKQ